MNKITKEYLEDYAKEDTKEVGNKLIEKELETLESEKVKELTKENVEKIAKGERDFRFQSNGKTLDIALKHLIIKSFE